MSVFGATRQCSGLPLGCMPGVTPGTVPGTVRGAGEQIGFTYVQGKCPASCTISLALVSYIFVCLFLGHALWYSGVLLAVPRGPAMSRSLLHTQCASARRALSSLLRFSLEHHEGKPQFACNLKTGKPTSNSLLPLSLLAHALGLRAPRLLWVGFPGDPYFCGVRDPK